MKDSPETLKTGVELDHLPRNKSEKHVAEVAEALCYKQGVEPDAKQDDKHWLKAALRDQAIHAGLLLEDF